MRKCERGDQASAERRCLEVEVARGFRLVQHIRDLDAGRPPSDAPVEGVVTLPPESVARPPYKLVLLPHGGLFRRPPDYPRLQGHAEKVRGALATHYGIRCVARWAPGFFANGMEIDHFHRLGMGRTHHST